MTKTKKDLISEGYTFGYERVADLVKEVEAFMKSEGLSLEEKDFYWEGFTDGIYDILHQLLLAVVTIW